MRQCAQETFSATGERLYANRFKAQCYACLIIQKQFPLYSILQPQNERIIEGHLLQERF